MTHFTTNGLTRSPPNKRRLQRLLKVEFECWHYVRGSSGRFPPRVIFLFGWGNPKGDSHLLKCSIQKSMYFSEPTGSPNSSQFLPLMMDDQLATSLSSTFFASTKIFLFLKWERFKRPWIRPVIELIIWLHEALALLLCPPLCMYCSAFFPATAFLFSINHSFLQTTLGLSLCPYRTDSLVGTSAVALAVQVQRLYTARTSTRDQSQAVTTCHKCSQPELCLLYRVQTFLGS